MTSIICFSYCTFRMCRCLHISAFVASICVWWFCAHNHTPIALGALGTRSLRFYDSTLAIISRPHSSFTLRQSSTHTHTHLRETREMKREFISCELSIDLHRDLFGRLWSRSDVDWINEMFEIWSGILFRHTSKMWLHFGIVEIRHRHSRAGFVQLCSGRFSSRKRIAQRIQRRFFLVRSMEHN